MIVTTGDFSSPHIKERARHTADAFGYVFVERCKQSLSRLTRKYGDDEFLVYTNDSVRYTQLGVTELTYHPSMAFVRAKRILAGESDSMIRASGATCGDEVLDCTAGFAADALVFSIAVGAAGRVVALESEPSLFALVHEGLQLYESDVVEVNEAMRRIELQRADHSQKLKSMPDRSMDIVYFDPMFREPVTHSSAFNPMRTMANHEALSRQAIAEAMRVARKRVVMKELRNSPEFARLGFNRVVQTGSKLAYGVIDIADNIIV